MFIGYPFETLSVKRSLELNDAIGGEEGSQHLYSEAADFTIPDHHDQLWRAFNWMRANCFYSIRQMILYINRKFIHVGMYPAVSRKEIDGPRCLYSLRGKLYVQNPLHK
jgi:hypothetical protein